MKITKLIVFCVFLFIVIVTLNGLVMAGQTSSYGGGLEDVWLIKVQFQDTSVEKTTPSFLFGLIVVLIIVRCMNS